MADACYNIVRGLDASYSLSASSGLHSQVNGVLAGLTLATLVFVVQQHRHDARARSTLALLPILFVSSVGAAFEFAVVSGDRICERSAVLYLLAASLYVLSVVTITAVFRSLIWLNLEPGAGSRDPATAAAGATFVVAAIAASLHYVVAWKDLAVEFGRVSEREVVLVAPSLVAASVVVTGARFVRSRLPRAPQMIGYAFLAGAVLFILGNLTAFALLASVTDWSESLVAFDAWWWTRYAFMASVGMVVGFLWAVSRPHAFATSLRSTASPREVVDEWDVGPIHRRRTTRY